MNIEIRRSTKEDIGDLVHVFNDSLEYKRSLGDDSWGKNLFDESELRAMFGISDLYLGLSGKEVVAAMSLSWSDTRVWGEQLGKDDKAVYIHQLAVKSSQRGGRLGEKLIEKAGELAVTRGRNYIRLDCSKASTGLINYYTKLGFEKMGEVVVKDNSYKATLLQKTVTLTD